MKTFITSLLLVASSATLASPCLETATRIADSATDLFAVGAENEIHCMAMGGRIAITELPVTMEMPVRSAYVASYFFPCGPTPRSPKVEMMLNKDCKIVNLKLTGFKL